MGWLDWLLRIFAGPPRVPRQRGPEQSRRTTSEDALRTTPQPGQRPRPGGAPAPTSAPPPETTRRSVGDKTLDAGQFTPLSEAEVKKRAGELGAEAWRSPWFGRTDRIPPADDPRTKLIDQALVGHGLLSADQLVEIHKAGAEMDEVRPDMGVAARAGERAVRASREERAERKRRKQAEAAERKAKRAAEILQRRATDIVYLGRGVSIGLADRRADIEKLRARGLPLLATPADVAAALGLSIPQLRWLAFHSEASRVTHYTQFEVPKKSGGRRTLAAPRRHVARCQQWVLENILSRVATSDAAHGFVPTRSTVSNATPHVGRDVVVNVDLKDFFPTITFPRVKGIFQGLGFSPAAATILGLLCTESPRRELEYDGQRLFAAVGPRALPQGACTSPALSNLASRNLDARLSGICSRLGWTYTRYADDLSFSAAGEAAKPVGYLLARVRHIVQDEGFAVNAAKTRVLRRNASQRVTGIVVNQTPGVPRRERRRMRAILHRAEREGLAAQNRSDHPYFESWVSGMLAYIAMVNPQQAAPLLEAHRRAKP